MPSNQSRAPRATPTATSSTSRALRRGAQHQVTAHNSSVRHARQYFFPFTWYERQRARYKYYNTPSTRFLLFQKNGKTKKSNCVTHYLPIKAAYLAPLRRRQQVRVALEGQMAQHRLQVLEEHLLVAGQVLHRERCVGARSSSVSVSVPVR